MPDAKPKTPNRKQKMPNEITLIASLKATKNNVSVSPLVTNW